ncbi:hypothetical protein D3C79_1072080 [compost metagenome]
MLSTPALKDAAEKVITDLVDENAEIVTVIYGEDTTEESASELVKFIEENYPEVEIELFNGKQGLYPYIISVE